MFLDIYIKLKNICFIVSKFIYVEFISAKLDKVKDKHTISKTDDTVI